NKWLLVSSQLRGEPGAFRIWAFNVQVLPASVAELNGFTLRGKSLAHYSILVGASVTASLSLYAFVLCIRAKDIKRKWLWAIFTLLGFGALTVNWSTGVVGLNPLVVNMFSAAVNRPGFEGPWFVSVSVPLGAILFLSRYRAGRRARIAEG